ncbi:MAG: ArsS family sensor histidine kinase [Sulfurovum sp.]|nr:ArsS family sensor histidine kinase [Sulfurovum sp.]
MITSLRSKIRLVFFVTLVLLATLFVFAIKYDHAKIEERNIAQEHATSHYLYSHYLQYGKIDTAYLEAQNISLITDASMLIKIKRFFKDKGNIKHYAVDTYLLKRIILINNDRFNLILENKNKPHFPLIRVFIFAMIFLLIIILYLWIMKSLKPLSQLKKKIKTFSEGNLDIDCKSDKQDEIAEVANEFDHAVTMIRELLQSRQLFLRAIMHELKTPIAKGRFMAEMLPDERNRERLHSIFERLNLLIDEFAKIEKITSKNFDLRLKTYKMTDLLETSIDMLMIENPSRLIEVEIEKDYLVEVDFELFTLVIKNLLDNALKYSIDKHIIVIISETSIEIMNHGDPLKEPLPQYFKPFHTSKKGLGLGLYIVKSILDLHKMELNYLYKEGANWFRVK